VIWRGRSLSGGSVLGEDAGDDWRCPASQSSPAAARKRLIAPGKGGREKMPLLVVARYQTSRRSRDGSRVMIIPVFQTACTDMLSVVVIYVKSLPLAICECGHFFRKYEDVCLLVTHCRA
jgi:hypothetical protein